MWVVDAKSLRFLEVNQAAISKYGYSAEEFLSMSIADIRPREDVPRLLQAVKMVPQGSYYGGQWRHLLKNGTLIDVEVMAHRVKHNGIDAILGTIRDVSDATRAKAELEKISSRNAALLEALPDMIFLMHRDGTFLGYKAPRAAALAVPPDQFLGKKITQVLPPYVAQPAMKLAQEALRDNAVKSMSYRLPDQSGAMKDYEARLAPCRDEIMIVVRDLTEQKNAQKEQERLHSLEKQARAQAEAVNRNKDEFLATLSHELRTPLTSMIGWTWLLRERRDPETFEQALRVIESSLKHQSAIIDDLLDTSSIIMGKLKISPRREPVWPVILKAIDIMRPTFSTKGVKLETAVKDESLAAVIDPERLQQMVWNLLSNAAKFTPEGGRIKLSLSCRDEQLEIKVADNGEGVSREALPHLFERFWRGDSTNTRSHSGLGLGLAIVSHLADLHGGSVSVESAGLGKGATFRILLPAGAETRAAAVPSAPPAQKAPPAQEKLDGLSILVVEDDRETLLMLSTVLERFGARVHAAQTCREALERFKRYRPDILVSDIAMPQKDGLWLIQRIRALAPGKGADTPALVLTALARPEDRAAALAAGFTQCLSKPVAPAELAQVIAGLARRGPK